jgi:predicted transposase/invertase (TIGR01784 family)
MMTNLVRFDWAMKKLLRSKANFSVLAGFLSELLHEDITILDVLESESNKEHEDDKFNRVDMLIRNASGALVVIEVQTTSEPDYLLRMLYASSKIITEHIDSGETYRNVKKVISVNIVYFDLGQGDDYLYRGFTAFHGLNTGGELLLNERQRAFYQQESIHSLYPEYYIIKVNEFDDVAKNTLDEWIYFLKNDEIKDNFSAKGLREAKQLFDVMHLRKEDRAEYVGFIEAMRTKSSLIQGNYDYGFIEGELKGREEGREEGRELGREEGVEQGLRLTAKNMLSEGLPLDTIAKITGLSIEKIQTLI